jgi:hypothetical protein
MNEKIVVKHSAEREQSQRRRRHLYSEDVRSLNSLKIKLALSCGECPNLKESYLMLEQERLRTAKATVINLEKVFGQYSPATFEGWKHVSLGFRV